MTGPRRDDQGGATLIEFALVMPVLLLLLLGILDVARAVNAYVVVSNASAEGANYAVLRPTAAPSAIASEVRSRVVPLDPSQVTVTASYYNGSTFVPWPSAGVPAASPPATVPVRVEVSYPWCAVTFLIGQFFGGGSCGSGATRTFSSSTTMDTRR